MQILGNLYTQYDHLESSRKLVEDLIKPNAIILHGSDRQTHKSQIVYPMIRNFPHFFLFLYELFLYIINIFRKFLKTEKNLTNNKMRVLPVTEKLEFVSKSVSWTQGYDILDTCFILNFGYKAPLPWPQV